MTGRLFHAGPPTPREEGGRSRAWRAAQTSLPLDDDPIARAALAESETCPACGGMVRGTGPACTCAATGAVALTFDITDPANEGDPQPR